MGEPARGLFSEIFRILERGIGRGRSARGGANQEADRFVPPFDRAPAPIGFERDAAHNAAAAGGNVTQHADRFEWPDREHQAHNAEDLRHPAARRRHSETDELARVPSVRHRVIGRQQIVLLVVGNENPDRDPAQVRAIVGAGMIRSVRNTDDRAVGCTGLGEADREPFGKIAAESHGCLVDGEQRLGMKGAVHRCRAGCFPRLQLRAHDVDREPVELQTLELGPLTAIVLRPCRRHHRLLMVCQLRACAPRCVR